MSTNKEMPPPYSARRTPPCNLRQPFLSPPRKAVSGYGVGGGGSVHVPRLLPTLTSGRGALMPPPSAVGRTSQRYDDTGRPEVLRALQVVNARNDMQRLL